MRTTLIILGLLLLALAGYAYDKNPAGCAKLGSDLIAIVQSLRAPAVPPSPIPNQAPKPVSSVPAPAVAGAKPAPAPVPSPSQALPENASTAVAPPAPIKAWTPPDVMPAQPNWTWTTSDGNTYRNVVVTGVDADTVTITHSMGVAHLPLAHLPPDIQKKLNYDPVVAAAAKAESDREAAHPYYRMAALADAQKAAHQLHRPLAWICGHLIALTAVNPPLNSEDELTQMVMNDLKSRAIVVFLDGNDDLPALSPIIRDQQLFKYDDGPVPGGHHFFAPKIVFSDADITRAYGRVSHTQLVASREAAIDKVLQSIAPDSAVGAPPASTPVPASSP